VPAGPRQRLPIRTRLRLSGQAWLLNVIVAALVCGAYLDRVDPATGRGWLFLQGGRVSCAASLSLVVGLPLLAVSALTARRAWLAAATALAWTLFLFALYVDTRIYAIFRYHFNGLVWNVLTTPGADEAVEFSRRDLIQALVSFAVLVPFEVATFLGLWRWNAAREGPPPRLTRPSFVWSAVLVPVMGLVAALYAWADLHRDAQVMAYAGVYPLYPRVTIKRFAVEHLGFELDERPAIDLSGAGILLDYPRTPPRIPDPAPGTRLPNILVIVIDSLRADMLAPDTMPRISAFAQGGRVFRDHLSSGNATRFGLFGLVYGLHGSYWKGIHDEHRSPALVDALIERGYEPRVLTSASMDFPEFRSTAWVRIEDAVEDRLPASRPGGRDDGVLRRFEEWLGERARPADPFFAFLLLDAPHQRYSFPEEEARFHPYLDEVAYGELADGASGEVREALFNRYRNAVHYADGISGRVLDALEASGELDSTLVVVTGDHGEEFFEHGFWGHTSNFTRSQSAVPLVLAGPGIPPGEETRPTSHLDVPTTLLELLGVPATVRGDWVLGENLLAPVAARARVVSGWDTVGLYVEGAILEVPMAAHGGSIAAYDESWKRVFDDAALLERAGPRLRALAAECRRFLR
jgi:membrane-anchored protein YejM (alkaline phosphatase superfamily)